MLHMVRSPAFGSLAEKTLRVLYVLGASAVSCLFGQIHRRVAERAEITLRKTIFPTN